MKEYLDTGIDLGKVLIVCMIFVILGFIFSITWKYSNYALYSQIKSLTIFEKNMELEQNQFDKEFLDIQELKKSQSKLASEIMELHQEDLYISNITKNTER